MKTYYCEITNLIFNSRKIVLNCFSLCRFSPELAAKRGLSPSEMSAVEAIHRAVEFNPHVPKVWKVFFPVILFILFPGEH